MRRSRLTLATLALTASCAALPVAAQAATKPSVTTSGTSKLTYNSVRLIGKVDPNKSDTQYSFHYGTSGKYTASTPLAVAGNGNSAKTVVADISSLTPNTTYHYRLYAASSAGVTKGSDRTFTTKKQPLGLSLGATPAPTPYGAPTTLTGNLAGTGNANKAIILKQNPFPFTAGLQPFPNQIVTDAKGNFSVALTSLTATTQYQAIVADKQSVASPVFTLPVSVIVSTEVTRHRVKRGRSIRFSGSVRPASDGHRVTLQKKSPSGKWVTVKSTTTRHRSSTRSVYGVSLTVTRGGTYRVSVASDGALTTGDGPEIAIRSYR